ncbi:MAG: V-type ATP synthase subunit A [Microscillaceae bacterium]
MENFGKVSGVVANLVTVQLAGPVSQNEIAYLHREGQKLMAEVIKVQGEQAFIQVFESTRGVRVGDPVEFVRHKLEVKLGPGLLGKIYDGLQNDLSALPGLFLQKGEYFEALNLESIWDFSPLAQVGQKVKAGDWLGEVPENWLSHKIMVPFHLEGIWEIGHIEPPGQYSLSHPIARLKHPSGEETEVPMFQFWPVKEALQIHLDKPRPTKILETGIRVFDTLAPIAEGGTGFIPGPFGSGKTILQHALSKQANADIIIIAACGERANEVVEIFKEFPELDDPRTGRKLMERTIIISNTSNMPVAAREASVYTAVAIGEYYRAMGLKVLILPDSTSRWAQALREMSNRMEELPGPDAFPMDLPAIISNFYARAGQVSLRNGHSGSITILGTVSPAGGNLKDPVAEATKKATRCFYALSQARADSKRYPAVDPIDSYSKYLEYPDVRDFLNQEIAPDWTEKISTLKNLLRLGQEAASQINILGDDSVPIEYHVHFWRAETIDFVILQQDAFDAIDASTPLQRQHYMLDLVLNICQTDFALEDFEAVSRFFKQVINLGKQMNYTVFDSEDFKKYESELKSWCRSAQAVLAEN